MDELVFVIKALICILLGSLAAYMIGRLTTMGAMKSILEARALLRKQREK